MPRLMPRIALALVFAMAIAASDRLRAAAATPTDQDPVSQARAVKLESELRCLVCQNQTIADSNAELAVDLRRQVREQIAAGRSDREIIDFMTARYGDFVLYRPPFRASTVLLWAGPALLLLVGGWMLVRLVRRRTVEASPGLTAEERERARTLLARDDASTP